MLPTAGAGTCQARWRMHEQILCGETISDGAFFEGREILPIQKGSALSIGVGVPLNDSEKVFPPH